MKKKIMVKESDENDILITFEEVEGEPEDFLRRKGYTNFVWSYIEFGEKQRIQK